MKPPSVMTKNLETADTIVKLVLAFVVIVLFAAKIIAGPFALLLVILSLCILVIYIARYLVTKRNSNKKA